MLNNSWGVHQLPVSGNYREAFVILCWLLQFQFFLLHY